MAEPDTTPCAWCDQPREGHGTRYTASAVHQAITQALNRERLLDTLTATVPDQADAYLDSCDNDPRIALEYAQAGIPPAMIPDLRTNGITAAQAAISINTTDRSAL